jgi:DNA-binding transcriptional LysR family regulator
MTPSKTDDSAFLNDERLPVKRTWAALILAFIEAVCVFSVAAAKAGVLLGAAAAITTGWAASLHRDAIRIPVLLIAMAGAGFNLYLIWNRRRLRNRPAAAWRKRPLTKRERLKTALVLWLSLLTLALGAAEIYFHRLLHHTIM